MSGVDVVYLRGGTSPSRVFPPVRQDGGYLMLGGIRDRVPGLAGPSDGRMVLGTYSGAVFGVGGTYEFVVELWCVAWDPFGGCYGQCQWHDL